MKVALVRRTSVTHIDGVNRFIAFLAEGFAKLGCEPLVVGWCYRGVERERLGEWFREMHGLDAAVPVRTLRAEPCEGDPWLRIAWDWWIEGSKLLREEGVDAAIVNGVVPLRFRPKIAVNHGITLRPGRLYLWAARVLYRGYDRVVCVSERLRCEVRSVLGVDCEVVPLPLKLDLYGPGPEERENLIVHVGTRPVKNPRVSVEAVEILRRRGFDVKLVVVGPPSAVIESRAVEWRFSIPEREKVELLRRAKALVLPSSYEAFPYVCLEAMACGTPVVVSSAVPEELVVDGFNGIRVGSLDPRDYADALERLLVDGELWSRLSRNGLEFVERFDHVEVAKRYLSIIGGLRER